MLGIFQKRNEMQISNIAREWGGLSRTSAIVFSSICCNMYDKEAWCMEYDRLECAYQVRALRKIGLAISYRCEANRLFSFSTLLPRIDQCAKYSIIVFIEKKMKTKKNLTTPNFVKSWVSSWERWRDAAKP